MNITRYILSSSACLLAAYCVFIPLFKNSSRFGHQRLFLVTTLILSLLLPAGRFRIDLPWHHETKAVPSITDQPLTYITTEYFNDQNQAQPVNYSDLLLYIYVAVMSVLLLNAAFQILRIAYVIKTSRKEKFNDLIICNGDKIKTPYSFLWWIFIPDNITDTEERQCIIAHESVHATQLHSVDIIIVEVLSSIMWFNPAIWLLRRSLLLLHEYLADEGTLSTGIERLKYQALLINQATEEKLVFVKSSFNNKLLKKRMIMMTEMKHNRNGKFRILNLISVSTIMFLTVAFLNSFFPKEANASAQKANVTATQEVKKDKKKVDKNEDKKDLKEVTVTDYQKQAPGNSSQNVTKDDSKDLKEITVIGYGTQKVNTKNNIIVSEANSDNLEAVTVVGYAKNGEQIPDSVNYIVDGVSVKSISDLNPDSIGSINVLKQDRLIIVRTKSYEKKISKITKPAGTIIISGKSSLSGNIIYILDDKKVSKEDVQKINPNDIQSISVLKDKEKIKVYGDGDHDGVIIITTKK